MIRFLFHSLILLVVLGITGIVFVGWPRYQAYKLAYAQGANVVYQQGEVLGISSEEAVVTVDFGQKRSDGSPLVFGGAHMPKLDHQDAWDQIQSSGITVIRSDFFLDRFLPRKITLADYKQNKNGVQDPANWNQTELNYIRNGYKEARKRGMKSMGIVTYAVDWLTHSKNNYGVPVDWQVYEDLVKKSYTIFRDDLDYLEIWNEPDFEIFLNTQNSGLSREEAYHQIVVHAVKAIREVDAEKNDGKRIQIGVGVISQPTHTKVLEKVLADSNLHNQIDFVSYHNYEHVPEPSFSMVKDLLAKNNLSHLPIFLTEWAHTPQMKQEDPYVLTESAIPYTGAKLINFFNMGLAGANYFSMQPLNPYSKRGDEGLLGFYELKNGKAVLLPVAKTWTLMSKTLGLGVGASEIYKTDAVDGTATSFRNLNGDFGVVIANDSKQTKTINFTIYNLPQPESYTGNAFVASGNTDGKKKQGTAILSNKSSGMTFKVVAPPESVVGVTLAPTKLVDKIPLLN